MVSTIEYLFGVNISPKPSGNSSSSSISAKGIQSQIPIAINDPRHNIIIIKSPEVPLKNSFKSFHELINTSSVANVWSFSQSIIFESSGCAGVGRKSLFSPQFITNFLILPYLSIP